MSLKKLLILITSFAFVISCSSLLGPEEDDSGSSWVPTVMFNGNNGTDTLSFNAVGEDSYPTYELSKEITIDITGLPSGVTVGPGYVFGSPYATATYLAVRITNYSSTSLPFVEIENLSYLSSSGAILGSNSSRTHVSGSTVMIGNDNFVSAGIGIGETAYLVDVTTDFGWTSVYSISGVALLDDMNAGEPKGSVSIQAFRYGDATLNSFHDAELVIKNTSSTTITTSFVVVLLFDRNGIPINMLTSIGSDKVYGFGSKTIDYWFANIYGTVESLWSSVAFSDE